ncbi:MAG: hypothetical protein IKF59_03620 [Lachnospiraceae bacterium]|nr:hypothetical protein [Lachnospiraceae bacterium]
MEYSKTKLLYVDWRWFNVVTQEYCKAEKNDTHFHCFLPALGFDLFHRRLFCEGFFRGDDSGDAALPWIRPSACWQR